MRLEFFQAAITYDDDTTRTLTSLESLDSYHETRNIIPTGVTLTWHYVFRFPTAATVETQKINLSFVIIEGFMDGQVELTVEHTNAVWGVEVLSLLSNQVRKKLGFPSPFLTWLGKGHRSSYLFLSTIIFVFLLALLGMSTYLFTEGRRYSANAGFETRQIEDIIDILKSASPDAQFLVLPSGNVARWTSEIFYLTTSDGLLGSREKLRAALNAPNVGAIWKRQSEAAIDICSPKPPDKSENGPTAESGSLLREALYSGELSESALILAALLIVDEQARNDPVTLNRLADRGLPSEPLAEYATLRLRELAEETRQLEQQREQFEQARQQKIADLEEELAQSKREDIQKTEQRRERNRAIVSWATAGLVLIASLFISLYSWVRYQRQRSFFLLTDESRRELEHFRQRKQRQPIIGFAGIVVAILTGVFANFVFSGLF